MSIIKNFKSTNIWNAFILNSIVTTLIVVMALSVNEIFDKYVIHIENEYSQTHKIVRTNILLNLIITFIITFIISMITYSLMYLIFGFGGGMLVIDK